MAIAERRRSVIKVHDDSKKVMQGAAGPEAKASQLDESGELNYF